MTLLRLLSALPRRPFYFIRHGQTDWNVEDIIQGSSDIPLNDEGLRQAAEAAEVLAEVPFDRVVASDLKRAFYTAEVIAARCNRPLEKEPGLRERHFGSAEGQQADGVKARQNWTSNSLSKIPLPDGETFEEMQMRMVSTVGRLLAAYPDEALLLVSHGAAFRGLYEALTGTSPGFRMPNAMPCRFAPAGEGWKLEKLMDISAEPLTS